MPAAEVDLSVGLVKRMIDSQFPQFGDLDPVEVANGWDNVVYRLGDELCVRVPRRELGADLIDNEVRFLPPVADGLPLGVSVALHVGEPEFGYPWRWTICRWYPGRHMGLNPPPDAAGAARDIGGFLAAFHRPAPDVPDNPWGRGAPLADRDTIARERIGQTVVEADRGTALALWQRCLDAPEWSSEPQLLHGDLHPLNVVVDDERVVAIIDFGDICSGDPACDMAIAWMLPDRECTDALRHSLAAGGGAADDNTWARAKGWALVFAVTYLANSADHPELNRLGHHTLGRVLEPDSQPG
ncbi:MAG: aminoglycoside phosphotransferase family protein [Actinomycetia bacterium]|nr:aminoglycoside phosphotransferase family protein [Actinomycetes bacterium]